MTTKSTSQRWSSLYRLASTCLGLAAAVWLYPHSAQAQQKFEIAAWVDHFDFSSHFDTEKREGLAQILDHVAETGATTILWRNCGGATMRYQSRVESHHHDSRIDKRRVPDSRPIGGWVRYGEAKPDIVATIVQMCKERGLRPGIHWPYEETHWSGWTIGGWNLEHPQYWGRTADGRPWWGRSSIAYEPVIRHKLDLVDELLERGIEILFLDFWRTGAWTPAYAYVDPVVESYREKFDRSPPADPKDPAWCRHVSGYVSAYLRRLRDHLNASGRTVELAVGIPEIAPDSDAALISAAVDWKTWIDEGLIDTLVINFIRWDEKAPLESTRKLYAEVIEAADGRCDVWCPVQQYNFTKQGLPAYEEASGKPNEELAASLMQIAHESGAAGISLECVDYNNYRPETREALRTLGAGPCRLVQPRNP